MCCVGLLFDLLPFCVALPDATRKSTVHRNCFQSNRTRLFGGIVASDARRANLTGLCGNQSIF